MAFKISKCKHIENMYMHWKKPTTTKTLPEKWIWKWWHECHHLRSCYKMFTLFFARRLTLKQGYLKFYSCFFSFARHTHKKTIHCRNYSSHFSDFPSLFLDISHFTWVLAKLKSFQLKLETITMIVCYKEKVASNPFQI